MQLRLSMETSELSTQAIDIRDEPSECGSRDQVTIELGSKTDADRVRTIGALCVAGDWACVHGDLAALAGIAEQLVAHTHERLYADLATFSEACRLDPDHVVAAWYWLKELVWASTAPP